MPTAATVWLGAPMDLWSVDGLGGSIIGSIIGCARLCLLAGGELDQIQFLLGDVSIQTTERYLGCKQRLQSAVDDGMGIEPEGVC